MKIVLAAITISSIGLGQQASSAPPLELSLGEPTAIADPALATPSLITNDNAVPDSALCERCDSRLDGSTAAPTSSAPAPPSNFDVSVGAGGVKGKLVW